MINEKQSNKESFKIKQCMAQNIFEYLSHSKKLWNRECLCKCEECIKLDFSTCLEISKEVNLDKTDEEVAITGNAEA